MSEGIVVTGTATVVFTITNVDDLLLLAAFFADPNLSARAVIVGQILGITVLTAGSAMAAALSVVVPPGYVALLGVFPLALGLRGLWRLLCRARSRDPSKPTDESEQETPTRTTGAIAVASITIANGGDNLGGTSRCSRSASRG